MGNKAGQVEKLLVMGLECHANGLHLAPVLNGNHERSLVSAS